MDGVPTRSHSLCPLAEKSGPAASLRDQWPLIWPPSRANPAVDFSTEIDGFGGLFGIQIESEHKTRTKMNHTRLEHTSFKSRKCEHIEIFATVPYTQFLSKLAVGLFPPSCTELRFSASKVGHRKERSFSATDLNPAVQNLLKTSLL